MSCNTQNQKLAIRSDEHYSTLLLVNLTVSACNIVLKTADITSDRTMLRWHVMFIGLLC
jgi:hypothetical protein